MKVLIGTMFIALLVSANGCMTYSTVQEAQGHPENAVWIGKNQPRPNPDNKPHPAYYLLTPLTVPADIATSPFQVGYWCYVWLTL